MRREKWDWLGDTPGHVRGMLGALVVRAGLAIVGLTILVIQLTWVDLLDNSKIVPQSTKGMSLGFSLTDLSVSFILCAIGYWGVIKRKRIGKMAVWAVVVEQAFWPIALGAMGLCCCGFAFSIPQIVLLFFMIRGLLSSDLKHHYASHDEAVNIEAHAIPVVSPRFNELQRRFDKLVEQWHRDTDSLSDSTGICIHPAYQRIIGLGPDALPLILKELRERGGHWFWALRAITGEDPVTPEMEGDIEQMKAAWLAWAKTKRL